MAINLSGFDPAAIAAYKACRDRVFRFKRKTVADYWYIGNELNQLREIVRGLPGLKWKDVYGPKELGFSSSTEHRLRSLRNLYDSAEEAGEYTSVNKALRAKGTGPKGEPPTVCPGARRDGVKRHPDCKGKKRPEYRYCQPCQNAWVDWEEADARAKRTAKRHAKDLLKAALKDDVNAALVRQLEEVREQLKEQDRTIALLRRAIADQDERLQMIQQQAIPAVPQQNFDQPTDYPAVTA